MEEHQKEMDELERKKQDAIKKQVMREKESRDEQMRQNYIKKRIEILKEKNSRNLWLKVFKKESRKKSRMLLKEKRKKMKLY